MTTFPLFMAFMGVFTCRSGAASLVEDYFYLPVTAVTRRLAERTVVALGWNVYLRLPEGKVN